jgi:hypothetical protein
MRRPLWRVLVDDVLHLGLIVGLVVWLLVTTAGMPWWAVPVFCVVGVLCVHQFVRERNAPR